MGAGSVHGGAVRRSPEGAEREARCRLPPSGEPPDRRWTEDGRSRRGSSTDTWPPMVTVQTTTGAVPRQCPSTAAASGRSGRAPPLPSGLRGPRPGESEALPGKGLRGAVDPCGVLRRRGRGGRLPTSRAADARQSGSLPPSPPARCPSRPSRGRLTKTSGPAAFWGDPEEWMLESTARTGSVQAGDSTREAAGAVAGRAGRLRGRLASFGGGSRRAQSLSRTEPRKRFPASSPRSRPCSRHHLKLTADTCSPSSAMIEARARRPRAQHMWSEFGRRRGERLARDRPRRRRGGLRDRLARARTDDRRVSGPALERTRRQRQPARTSDSGASTPPCSSSGSAPTRPRSSRTRAGSHVRAWSPSRAPPEGAELRARRGAPPAHRAR